MIFASIDPRALADPQPWVEYELERRLSQKEVDAGNKRGQCWYGLAYEPRHKFVPTTAHPVNPILADLRDSTYYAADFLAALDNLHPLPAGTGHRIEPAHVDHARKVLTRLVALENEALGDGTAEPEENFWDDRTTPLAYSRHDSERDIAARKEG